MIENSVAKWFADSQFVVHPDQKRHTVYYDFWKWSCYQHWQQVLNTRGCQSSIFRQLCSRFFWEN